jgi:hypothetical protein
LAESLADERAANEERARTYRDKLMLTKMEVFDQELANNGLFKKSFF